MYLLEFLQSSPVVAMVVAGVLGLIVGSFLNVVIYRLPRMLDRQWRDQCLEFLQDSERGGEETALAAGNPESTMPDGERFDLVVPRSRCPRCGHAITALENIPLVSYIALRGKCSSCGTPISLRYPAVEALSGVLCALAVWHFGVGWEAAAGILLAWSLIALSFIDLEHHLLPDAITLPLIWIGLFISLFGVFTDPRSAIVGALAGYLVLWSVYQLFKLLTRKEGMGYGDFKLLAALGAWIGWQALPVIVILSSLVGAIVGIGLIALRGRDRNIPIPFGPYLALAGWLTLLWGSDMTQAYFRWAGL